jgi:hypothetical protein
VDGKWEMMKILYNTRHGTGDANQHSTSCTVLHGDITELSGELEKTILGREFIQYRLFDCYYIEAGLELGSHEETSTKSISRCRADLDCLSSERCRCCMEKQGDVTTIILWQPTNEELDERLRLPWK